jgi:hypothetical protein
LRRPAAERGEGRGAGVLEEVAAFHRQRHNDSGVAGVALQYTN